MKTIFDPRKLRMLFRPRLGAQVARRRVTKAEKKRRTSLTAYLKTSDEFRLR